MVKLDQPVHAFAYWSDLKAILPLDGFSDAEVQTVCDQLFALQHTFGMKRLHGRCGPTYGKQRAKLKQIATQMEKQLSWFREHYCEEVDFDVDDWSALPDWYNSLHEDMQKVLDNATRLHDAIPANKGQKPDLFFDSYLLELSKFYSGLTQKPATANRIRKPEICEGIDDTVIEETGFQSFCVCMLLEAGWPDEIDLNRKVEDGLTRIRSLIDSHP